jgi:hypothetical protein
MCSLPVDGEVGAETMDQGNRTDAGTLLGIACFLIICVAMKRYAMPSTRTMISGQLANRKRSWNGKLNTHWRMGCSGKTSSISNVALSAMRRTPACPL